MARSVEFLANFGDKPALGVLELDSTARGIVVADAVVKRAPSLLLMSRPVSGGKHLVMFRGDVASVDESMQIGTELADRQLIDKLELPYAHEQLWPLLNDPVVAKGWENEDDAESVAIVETSTVCATLHAADAAAKAAAVTLRDVRLAVGIAGKAFFTMTGELPDIQAAADAARDIASDRLLLLEVIASPAPDIRGRLLF